MKMPTMKWDDVINVVWVHIHSKLLGHAYLTPERLGVHEAPGSRTIVIYAATDVASGVD